MTTAIPSAAPPLEAGDSRRLSLAERQALVARHGSQSSAYFTLQREVEHFGIAGKGFVAYHPQRTPLGRVNMVFANPVCATADLPALLRAFIGQVGDNTLFMGVDRQVCDLLARMGYYTNEMGTEFSLAIANLDLRGKTKKQLRHAANLGQRCGLKVQEQDWETVDQSQVRAISAQWRQRKTIKQRELRLLTRPPEFANEWEVRKFYCYQGDKLLGFVFFDPFFAQGKVAGYCANILRRTTGEGPSDLLDFVMLEAIKVFRAEGIERLSLGVAPLYQVKACLGDNPLLRRIEQWLFSHGNRLYAFEALAYHKTRYRAEETPWYVCARNLSALKVSLAVLLGTHLVGW